MDKIYVVYQTQSGNANFSYKVTAIGEGKGTVEVTAVKNKKITFVTVPAIVAINNEGYKVTAISNKAFSKCTTLTKITIPAKISKIGKQSF